MSVTVTKPTQEQLQENAQKMAAARERLKEQFAKFKKPAKLEEPKVSDEDPDEGDESGDESSNE